MSYSGVVHFVLFEMVCHWPNMQGEAGHLASPRTLSVSTFPALDLTPHAWLLHLHGFWALSSGPYVCKATTLSTEFIFAVHKKFKIWNLIVSTIFRAVPPSLIPNFGFFTTSKRNLMPINKPIPTIYYLLAQGLGHRICLLSLDFYIIE